MVKVNENLCDDGRKAADEGDKNNKKDRDLQNTGCKISKKEVPKITDTSWYCDILLEGRYRISFLIDTGAVGNVLSLNILTMLNINVKKYSTDVVLCTFGNFKVRPLYEIKLKTSCNEIETIMDFLVVDVKSDPILGLPGCLTLNLLSKHFELAESSRFIRGAFVIKNHDIFVEPKVFPDKYHINIKKSAQPVVKPLQTLPQTFSGKLKEYLDGLVHNNVAVKVDQPKNWCSDIVVTKTPHDFSLILDVCELNKAVEPEYHVLPELTDIISKCRDKQFYTLFKVKSYLKIELDEESSDLLTFSCPLGYYKCTKLFNLLACTGNTFIRYNEKHFGDIDPDVIVYTENILIATETIGKHLRLIDKVVLRARKCKTKFALDKLQYLKKRIIFLGHQFKVGKALVVRGPGWALRKNKCPTDKTELQRIFTILISLRERIPSVDTWTKSLRLLLKKGAEWNWTKEHADDLYTLKKKFYYYGGFRQFNPNSECVVHCSASKYGLGCCLIQNNIPIVYYSCTLKEREVNYSRIEKEMLCLLFACRKLNDYVLGRHIKAYSAYKPLVNLMLKDLSKIPNNTLRIMRLALFENDMEVSYLPGKRMPVAKYLSHNYMKENFDYEPDLSKTTHSNSLEDPRVIFNLPDETMNDSTLQIVKRYVMTGFPRKMKDVDVSAKCYYNVRNDLTHYNNVLYYDDEIIVPSSIRFKVVKLLHDSDHSDVMQTMFKAKQLFYWPGMVSDIKQLVAQCGKCKMLSVGKRNEPLPRFPFEKLAADVFCHDRQDYIVIIDYISKWIELFVLNARTASAVIRKFKHVFAIHGIPKQLVASGNPFNSREFKQFSKEWNFKVMNSSPRDFKLAAEAVQITKRLLEKSKKEGTDIESVLLEYRCTPISRRQVSPSEILMNRVLRTKLPAARLELKPKIIPGIRTELVIKWAPGRIICKTGHPGLYLDGYFHSNILSEDNYHSRSLLNQLAYLNTLSTSEGMNIFSRLKV